jgi:hypothetical protein
LHHAWAARTAGALALRTALARATLLSLTLWTLSTLAGLHHAAPVLDRLDHAVSPRLIELAVSHRLLDDVDAGELLGFLQLVRGDAEATGQRRLERLVLLLHVSALRATLRSARATLIAATAGAGGG